MEELLLISGLIINYNFSINQLLINYRETHCHSTVIAMPLWHCFGTEYIYSHDQG